MPVAPKPAALSPTLARVTARIAERSTQSRAEYLATMAQNAAARKDAARYRAVHGCANYAHAFAAMPLNDKLAIRQERLPNIGVVTAYNDLLSAHQPYEHYPEQIRQAARRMGATAQVAGGVPAMCDGVTQGTDAMDLSLFSRDVIAMATAVALSHNVFDGALCLGVCDKIVPGLLIGALQFGHLPMAFVPAGPMASGLPNDEKAKVRQQYAQGLVGRKELLAAEEAAYHSAGTCTFYGTANSNQMLMEFMGLHLPSSSFVNPGTPLRHALTDGAVAQLVHNMQHNCAALADIVDEKAIVNGMVGLLATGGSTNHTLHLVAMARAAGIRINWQDFAELSSATPLLARVYPNGKADVNHFHAAGGVGLVMQELLGAGLLHGDVTTVLGKGLANYCVEPWLDGERLMWRALPTASSDTGVVRPVAQPFDAEGGIKLVQGNLGRAVVKTSAVAPEHRVVKARAVVIETQKELQTLFDAGDLTGDLVVVARFQGPRASGMPELHKLTPVLGILQDRGQKVALVTDGRMSGASGKVPAAIHVSPEALDGGLLAKVHNGDVIALDCDAGVLTLCVDAAELALRSAAAPDLSGNAHGSGRELFGIFRRNASAAEAGACPFFD